jgi:glycosyltransferase involved in cell wall biosynthesis
MFPLAVDTEVFHPPSTASRRGWRQRLGIDADDFVIMVVGRLVPSKRFRAAVGLAQQLRRRGLRARVVIVGKGPEEDELRVMAAADEGCAVFAGALFDTDLAGALGAADVLCSTSEYEGFGLTLVEGMACGLPVVAREVGGVTDIVKPDLTGYLCGGDGESEMLERLTHLALNPDQREAMGLAARAAAMTDFSVSRFVSSFLAVYEALLEDRALNRSGDRRRGQT